MSFPPPRFDDYVVIGPLGAGGMGTVFLGHDAMLDRRVALKFIAEVAPDTRARARFLQEARALARLHHPNVVGVYRIGAVERRPYLAYELVDGEPVHRLGWPMSWRRALRLGVGVARGLAAVHATGVLHRDIKPANIVVGKGDVAKLIDFGLASRLDEDSSPGAVPTSAATDTTQPAQSSVAQLAGTPTYMAPELWTGTPPSAASDVYALGLVLWQLLAGDLPFAGYDADALVLAIRSRALPPVASARLDLPLPLAELVDRCVARAPADRPSAAALRDGLETILAVYAPLVGAAGEEGDEQRAADMLAESFGRATADPDRFAQRFYEHAFTLEPSIRALFPSDMSALRVKLVSTLHTVVRNTRAPERLVPLLEDLGERHLGYGVRPGNFEVMGRALLSTLAELEGPRWDPPAEALWARAYQHIAEHMTRGLERAAQGVTPRSAPPLTRLPIDPPEPRFATAGAITLGYQSFGNGSIDVLVLPGGFGHLEGAWQEPGYAMVMSRLSQRARITVLDRRGTGLSDRAPGAFGLHDHVQDALAVMDAAGIERPFVLATADATATAVALAATHPERVRGLVLSGGTPCPGVRPDHPDGVSADRVDALCTTLKTRWGEPLLVEEHAGARAEDPAFRAWWARYLRSAVSPATAIALIRAAHAVDTRPALAAIQVPSLVLQGAGDPPHVRAGGRAFVTGIRGARIVEVAGDGALLFARDPDPMLREIEHFLRDAPTALSMPACLIAALAVQGGELGKLRAAIEREGGVIVSEEDGAIAATFALPDPALRAVVAAAPGARAAVHSGVVGRDRGGEAPVIASALATARETEPGMVSLDVASAALSGRARTCAHADLLA